MALQGSGEAEPFKSGAEFSCKIQDFTTFSNFVIHMAGTFITTGRR